MAIFKTLFHSNKDGQSSLKIIARFATKINIIMIQDFEKS